MPNSNLVEISSDVTLGEVARRLDSFQHQTMTSMKELAEKVDSRPSWSDIQRIETTLRGEIAHETNSRNTAVTAVNDAIKAVADNQKYMSRTITTAIVSGIITIVVGVIVFFLTK